MLFLPIVCYFTFGYFRLYCHRVFVAIVGYFISGYYSGGYWWLLVLIIMVVIPLVGIGSYFINGY